MPNFETKVPLVVHFDNGLRADVGLTLVGPGDIAGLDSNVVVRVWPTPDDNDAEFESLVLIELDQADLPWRYTPAAANASGQLRPWLSLLVFEEALTELDSRDDVDVLHVLKLVDRGEPTAYFGGIESIMWTWSGIRSDS